tara:strand:+ start:3763 stop:4602 length:840 start_codon:yes stop_codon:yes gene_type:complete
MSFALSTGMMGLGENAGSSNITEGDINNFFSRNTGYTRGQLNEDQYQQFVDEQRQEGADVRVNPILSSGAYLDSSLPNPDTGIPHTSRDMMTTDAQGNSIANRDDIFASGSLDDALMSVNNGRVSSINLVDGNVMKGSGQDIVIKKDNQYTGVKGIVEESSVSDYFLSGMNTKVIQDTIRYRVFQETDKVISEQDTNALYIVMRSVLLQFANFGTDVSNLAEEIRKLNARVVNYCVGEVGSNTRQYVMYLEDLTKLPTPIDRPGYVGSDSYTYDISNLL